MSSSSEGPSLVLYPAPGIGHVISMVEMAKLVRRHRPPVSVTILLTTGLLDTPAISSYLDSTSATHPYIHFHRFPHLSLPPRPPGTTSVSRAAIVFELIRLNTEKHLLLALRGIPAPAALVIDFFCASAIPVARSLSLPTYYFYTSGTSVLAYFLCLPEIFDRTTGSFKDCGNDVVFEFPGGLPPLKGRHMVEPALEREDPAFEGFRYFCLKLKDADGILVNTFEELETTAMDVLVSGKCLPESATPPVYCIGPLIAGSDAEPRPGSEHECLKWLDNQPSKSVVFLCFGSRGVFSVPQIEQIAIGLENSSHRFLWVVKPPPKHNMDVLDDPAAGSGFLDMVLPPGFCERTKEVERVVRELMDGGKEVREKCLVMKSKASEAFAQFGSSWNNIEKLVDLWKI
ncbi:hypothetical protein MLD38_040707 [Melastoma candidum]|nr:hypothetical protein MLD38_040707 [Melastoma candidum]